MLLYRDLYGCLGSYDLARAKWDFDIGSYYNLWVSAYLQDQHLDLDFLRLQLRLQPFVLRVVEEFGGLFRRAEASLRERGEYFRNNVGHFYHGLTNIDFSERVGLERSHEEVIEKAGQIFNCVRAQALELLGSEPAAERIEPLPVSSFLTGRAFA
jgi:hypothetical protein